MWVFGAAHCLRNQTRVPGGWNHRHADDTSTLLVYWARPDDRIPANGRYCDLSGQPPAKKTPLLLSK